MSTGILDTIGEASVNAWKSTKPAEVMFGEVESTDPLKVKVSSLLTLGKKQCTVNGTVSKGSKVIVVRVQGGQKYVVLGDRTATITEYMDTGGTVSSGGWIYPLGVQATLSSKFGKRKHPITGKNTMHTGVDLACPRNTAVLAAKDGKVEVARICGGYGKCIVINHGGGYKTRYAHLNSYNCRQGQDVKQGQVIGRVDSTGTSTGNHLHFEVIVNGVKKNPFNYIPSRK